MLFGCIVISDLHLFQQMVLLNPCFTFSKNLTLSFIDKVTTGTKFSIIYLFAPSSKTGGLASRLPAIPGVIDISDIIHSFNLDK